MKRRDFTGYERPAGISLTRRYAYRRPHPKNDWHDPLPAHYRQAGAEVAMVPIGGGELGRIEAIRENSIAVADTRIYFDGQVIQIACGLTRVKKGYATILCVDVMAGMLITESLPEFTRCGDVIIIQGYPI